MDQDRDSVCEWNRCGSRLIPGRSEDPLIQEWKVDSWSPRLRVARGYPVSIRFAVTPASDWLYGVNISNWPEGWRFSRSVAGEVEFDKVAGRAYRIQSHFSLKVGVETRLRVGSRIAIGC